MGTHVFTWTAPADEVYVTGTFDDWSKSVQLAKENGVFTKQVDLPSNAHDILYKFVVDGKWVTDSAQPTSTDHEGNENNILRKEDIHPLPAGGRAHTGAHPVPNTAAAIRSGVGPGATSAALAGAVPLEKDRKKGSTTASDDMPGTFPSDTPVAEGPGAKAAPGSSATDFFSAGDIVPDFSTYKSATMPTDPDPSAKRNTNASASGKAAAVGAGVLGAAAGAGGAAVAGAKQAGEKAKDATMGNSNQDSSEGEQKFGVSPLPATSGIGNPIYTKPGEGLPPSEKYTANTTTSNVKLDKESYEKSDAYPTAGSAPTSGTAAGTIIPESSLPMGQSVSDGPADVTAIRSAAGTDTTTAALAGQQPIEPRGVPEVVRDSQQEAHASPEASINPEATAEKSAMEKELKSKVPEEEPASQSSTAKSAAAGVAGGAGAVAAGGAALAAGVPEKVSHAVSNVKNGNSDEGPADAVPEAVKQSEKEARVSPEAAANPEAVKDKSDMERELTSKVPIHNETGPPAPVTSAATMATAPRPQTGVEGGDGKDTTKDIDGSTTEGTEKKGGIIAGMTGAAAAVGGAAYAATQSAKDKITGSQSAPAQQEKATEPDSNASAFAKDPVESPDSPMIADEGTAGAIAAATGMGEVGEPTPDVTSVDPTLSTSQEAKPDTEPAAPKSGSTTTPETTGPTTTATTAADTTDATPSSDSKPAETALNATKETPAHPPTSTDKSSVQAAQPSTDTAAPTKAAETQAEQPSTTPARRERLPSREVSPMTKDDTPRITDGVASASASPKTDATPSSSASPTSKAEEKGHKKKKSLMMRLKDRFKSEKS
ncbi:MAG: hypothetical protein Q9159_007660 [Coniocarpon cinnabarinum]